jgi:hypothetical protein
MGLKTFKTAPLPLAPAAVGKTEHTPLVVMVMALMLPVEGPVPSVKTAWVPAGFVEQVPFEKARLPFAA